MPIWTRFVGRRVVDIGGMEERGAVHPLIQIELGHVGVAIKMDDADVAIDVRCQTANIRVSDRMIATEDHREDPALVDVRNGLVDLVEALLDVGRDYRDIADIDHVQRFGQVEAELEVVSVMESTRWFASPGDRIGCQSETWFRHRVAHR